MSKKKEQEPANLFGEFSSLRGEFTTPVDESTESDIITGDETVLKDDEVDLSEGDKKLNEVIEKTIKAKEKKEKIESGVELEETDEEEEEEVDDLKVGIKEFTDSLYKKNVIDFDSTDEDFDATEESIDKLVTKTVAKRIDNWANTLPDDFHKLLEFVEAGGKPKDFLDVYYGNHSWEGFTIDTEDNQKAVVRESLRLAGEEPSDIEEIVTEWFDNGTLEKRAKSALTKVQKHESTQKAEILEITKAKDLERKQKEKESFENFKKELYSKEDIKGFKITDKQKDKLWEFMTVPDRTGKTGYDKALETNTDAAYLFALQAMNGFDITKLEKQVETKVTKKVNSIFKNYSKDSKQKISSGVSEEIQETNPFAEFKKIK